MSITSRQRNVKRPTSSNKGTRKPGPDLGIIPFKPFGLIPARDEKTTGAFGGVTRARRAILKDERTAATEIVAEAAPTVGTEEAA